METQVMAILNEKILENPGCQGDSLLVLWEQPAQFYALEALGTTTSKPKLPGLQGSSWGRSPQKTGNIW